MTERPCSFHISFHTHPYMTANQMSSNYERLLSLLDGCLHFLLSIFLQKFEHSNWKCTLQQNQFRFAMEVSPKVIHSKHYTEYVFLLSQGPRCLLSRLLRGLILNPYRGIIQSLICVNMVKDFTRIEKWKKGRPIGGNHFMLDF